MNEKHLIEGLVSSVGDLPTQVDVIGLQRFSLDDLQRRTKRFLSLVGQGFPLMTCEPYATMEAYTAVGVADRLWRSCAETFSM